MSPRSLFERAIDLFDLRSTGKWFVLAAAVGVVAGVGAALFQFLTQAVVLLTVRGIAGHEPGEPAGEHWFFTVASAEFSIWMLVAVMVVGGLVSGWLVYTFAPEAEGHGTDAAIEAFHHKRGYIRPRIPLIKMLASAITIGTGGSGGREGPIAQIGAGFGSVLATRLRLPARDRRILLAAGVGAGIGAIFRAPLAGALFAAEILYREADIESDVVVPAAMASIVSYTTYCLLLPHDLRFSPLFGGGLNFRLELFDLLPLAFLALILVLFGLVYVKTFYGTTALMSRIPLPPHVRPAIGALLTGLFAVGVFYSANEDPRALAVLSSGYGIIQEILDPRADAVIGLLLLVAAGKILTTSLTIGSGGSGGVFGPSMVIGACVGGAVGYGLDALWPGLISEPRAYVIVGMAGFFAGCAHAPISTLIMVSELTGDYQLLLPVMWVSTLCFLLSRRWTLYDKQVSTRLDSPAHRGDFIVDVLAGYKVADALESRPLPRTVSESTTLDEIVHMLAETEQNYFPVVDEDGKTIGIFGAKDVRSYIYDESMWSLTVARDVMTTRILSVSPQSDLGTALRRFTEKNLDELPVFADDAPGHLVGMLRRKDTIAFYNEQLQRRQLSDDSAIEDGAIEDGAIEDGAIEDGAIEDGGSDEGQRRG